MLLRTSSASYRNSRARLNPELDTRPRTGQSTLGVGTIVRVGGKTAIDLSVNRTNLAYAHGIQEDGVSLGDALSHQSDQVTLRFVQDITPLTRINVTGEVFRDQFEVSSRRNADSIRMTTGFESTGQLKGHARVGLRTLKPEDRSLPESHGLFVSVGTGATLFDRIQIGIDADRDVVPSYRPDIDYYESYGYGAMVSYAMRSSLRLSASLGRRFADYRTADGAPAFVASQAGMEYQMTYGSGINVRLGDGMSIDVSGVYTERTSVLALRRFNGVILRAGVSHAF